MSTSVEAVMTGDQRGAQDRDVSLIRSQLMARIHGRDTSPELILRKALWSAGCDIA